MKIIDFLEMLFPRNKNANSGQQAKERLQLVLAHDRATITPEVIESMRREILDVVARYVDINIEEMEFGLENSQRITSLIANLPIRKVKRGVTAKIETSEKDTAKIKPLEKDTKSKTLSDEMLEL